TVYTTLDPWLEEAARRAVAKARHQAALVALDPRTGAIRALIGGRDFAKAPYDRAALAMRQPGSAFKPVVYAAALTAPDGGTPLFTAASLIDDSSRTWSIAGGTWTPRDYDRRYRGRVSVRDALADSLNAATVDMTAQIGVDRVIEMARRLGVATPLKPELGLALGDSEVTLLELTGVYCAFDNGGLRVEPYGIEEVVDPQGAVLEAHRGLPERVLGEGEAYLMTDLLREVVRSGTARGLGRRGLGLVAAGKTGTTEEGRDAWFVGFTPWLAAGVWTGEDLPKPLGITGASAALPVWAGFMVQTVPPDLLKPGAPDPFPRPASVETAVIDPASGLLARDSCPQRRTELFVDGSKPKQYCPLHKPSVVEWFKDLFHRAAPSGGRR
ncbi:MAG: hypothetical protein KGL53_15975, partial [Elusimicrobia bacterium]|nr:hypothetical protein [Elusimicrobiota bacterium]